MATYPISLFDLSTFDSFTFDSAVPGPASPSGAADDIQFNGYGLQNENIAVEKILNSGPVRAMTESGFPRAHGEYIQTDYFRKKIITLKGWVQGATQEQMEQYLDELTLNLSVPNGTLMKTFAGARRYWECYVDFSKMLEGREHYNISWTPWEATFTAINPFARGEARTALSPPTEATASPTVYEPANGGTAPSSPIWTFTFVTAGTCTELTLTNDTTNEAITVDAAFADGDVVLIDGENHVVTLNGVAADYTGVFPSIDPGTNSFSLTPNGAGFSISVQEQHFDRYLL